MTALYSLDDLVRLFDQGTLSRGGAYQVKGQVKDVTVSYDGETICGTVDGSLDDPYEQVISVERRKGKLVIDGDCTCPVSHNCKHVAAVLLDHLARPGGTRMAAPEPTATGVVPRQPVVELKVPGTAVVPLAPPAARPALPSTALSQDVTRWLDRLLAAGTTTPVAKPHDDGRTLMYVLNHTTRKPGVAVGQVSLRPIAVRSNKDGTIAEEKTYDPVAVTRGRSQIARFLTLADIDILRDLAWLKHVDFFVSPDIELPADAVGTRVLAEALATGHVRLGKADGPALAIGPAVQAQPKWIGTADGRQRLTLVPDQLAAGDTATRFDTLLPLSPPHYVDAGRGLAGVIETGLPAAMAQELLRTPAIAPHEAALVRDLMAKRLRNVATAVAASDSPGTEALTPSAALPLPEAPDNVETRIIAPVPRLELFVADARIKSQFTWYTTDPKHRGTFKIPLARLAFDYGGHGVAHSDNSGALQFAEDDKIVLVPRDSRAELAAFDVLTGMEVRNHSTAPFNPIMPQPGALFAYPPANGGRKPDTFELAETFDDPERFLTFSTDAVPALRAKGWTVTFSDDYPYRIAEGEVGWWADVGEGTGIDWFSFELGIEFEGQRINLIPSLASAIDRMPPDLVSAAMRGVGDAEWAALCRVLRVHHMLPDGRLLPLPGERVAPLLKAMIELVGPRYGELASGRISLHRAEASALSKFAASVGSEVEWAVNAERLIELGNRLREGRKPCVVKPPKTFKASLRPYQLDGLAWLDFLRDSGFGGALADDMGLGKTVQALAYLTREKAQGRLDRPALIVAPTSVLPNWKAEAARFAPGLSVLALYGPDRAQHFGRIPDHDIVLTTYPLLARDAGTLLEHEFHAAILDEAQAIKNPKAAISGIAHGIKARHRLALTGTPLENNLGEVWSLFQFLNPGLLGDESTFRRVFRTPIEKHGDQDAQAFLSRRLKPFMLRRTKDLVAKELPKKTEITVNITLEGAQRDLYETVRALMDKSVRDAINKKGLAKSHIEFLTALLKLRQVCCDPRLLKLPAARNVRTSAKLDRLMEMLPELISEGRRILIFSQFTSMLELIEDELRREKIEWVKLTGDTTDREIPVKAFQAGNVPVFLLSLKAGGTGLNLTAADTVIHYDPWWNPAVENQATDRAHRIGQTKPVFVYKLIVDEGVETAIEQLKARKSALADALFAGGTGGQLDITDADIRALFAPLSAERKRIAA